MAVRGNWVLRGAWSARAIWARLEGLDKAGRGDAACRILVSETTRHCLDESFSVQRLGEFKLQGKREAVEVYHVLGFASPAERASAS